MNKLLELGCAELTFDKFTHEITVVTNIPGATLTEKTTLKALLSGLGVDYLDMRCVFSDEYEHDIHQLEEKYERIIEDLNDNHEDKMNRWQ